MPDDPRTPWRSLGTRLAVGVLAAAGAVVLGRVVQLEIAPVPAILIGLVTAVATWLLAQFEEPRHGPDWEQPQPPADIARSSVDLRTRRVASMLAHAQPGQVFEAGALARTLAGLAAQRLVRNHDLPAEDTLAHATGHLSPGLLAYLRAADDDRPPTLRRRALHAHLKEIDAL